MGALDMSEIAEAPEWLDMSMNVSPGLAVEDRVTKDEWEEDVNEGGRNDKITRLAGHALRQGDPPPAVERKLRQYNEEHCKPPLSDEELLRILNSVGSREKARRSGIRKKLDGLLSEMEGLDTNAKLEHRDECLSVIIELPHTEHDAYLRPLAKSTGITIKNLRAQVQAHADTSVEDEPVDQKIIEAGRQFAEQLGDRVMEELDKSTQAAGVVGESANTKILYLVVTSRLLSNPASAVVKGVSSGGKSFTVKKVIDHFPPRTLIIRTGMSPKALAYTDESLKHRTIVLYEVEGIPEDGEYLIRSLLSEGRVAYETVESTPLGLKPRVIVKEGPTNLIATTTRSRIHPENETRVLSLSINDTAEQTRKVLRGIAGGSDAIDYSKWHALQHWLSQDTPEVVIPFAGRLAELTRPVTPRVRRDFRVVLTLVSAHALLCQTERNHDPEGRIIATIEDYAVVRELVAIIIEEACQAAVKPTVRETVEAVEDLTCEPDHSDRSVKRGKDRMTISMHIDPDGDGKPKTASVTEVARWLGIDRSTASRRVAEAIDLQYVVNWQSKPGRPARLEVGEPLPDEEEILPGPEELSE